jgi:Ca2+-binding EF-hand superfamily protein
MRTILHLLVVAVAALVSSAVCSQQPPFDLIRQFSMTLLPGMTLDVFLDRRRVEFRQADIDGDDAISPADVTRQAELEEARRRANRLALILRADRDGDGTVSREELEQFAAAQPNRAFPVAEVMRFDRDQDGRLSWSELIAYAQAGAPSSIPALPILQAMMALDEDRDGKTTWTEYRNFAERFFQTVDADHDGAISLEEIEAHRQRTGFGPPPDLLRQRPPLLGSRMTCDVPTAPPGARLLLLAGLRGEGLSTVRVGAENEATRTATIAIEPGDEPLYLVLATLEPMIWQFDGAVGRLVKVVLISMSSSEGAAIPVGATGLAKDVAVFATGRGCGPMVSHMLDQAGRGGELDARRQDALAMFKRLLGREPDLARQVEKVWNIKLPSGQVESAQRPDDTIDPSLSALVFKRTGKGDFTYVLRPGSRAVIGPADAGSSIRIESPAPSAIEELRSHLARDYPGGIVQIDPTTVVSAAPVAAYEVLPKEAGLIQLLESGAIERNARGEYLVKRKIHYPPGVSGKFLILKGVPEPDGAPGRSTVVSEDTGDFICKRDPCP